MHAVQPAPVSGFSYVLNHVVPRVRILAQAMQSYALFSKCFESSKKADESAWKKVTFRILAMGADAAVYVALSRGMQFAAGV